MGKSTAIKVVGLGKQYVLGGAEKVDVSFREMLTGALAVPFRRLKRLQGSRAEEEIFWALKDVDFKIMPGEVVGIIGRNGAGKSTLLKILSRITDPSEGRVEIRGRVSSLLEVGTGFHPELTGRENVFLNGAILGMTRQEIRKKFDEIVAFAEVEKFLDTPVKRYSSGMYVRLAFAVAAHLEPEILIVDEVLAVGDAEFQKKCLGRMQDVGKEGRTVLFVSHNMGAVGNLCSRAICLQQGQNVLDGDVGTVIGEYIDGGRANTRVYEAKDDHEPGYPYIKTVLVLQDLNDTDSFRIDKPIRIVFTVERQQIKGLTLAVLITNSLGVCIYHSEDEFGEVAPDASQVECIIPPYGLGAGKHFIDIALHKRNYQCYEWNKHILSIDVMFTGILSDQTTGSQWQGVCGPGLLQWKTCGE